MGGGARKRGGTLLGPGSPTNTPALLSPASLWGRGCRVGRVPQAPISAGSALGRRRREKAGGRGREWPWYFSLDSLLRAWRPAATASPPGSRSYWRGLPWSPLSPVPAGPGIRYPHLLLLSLQPRGSGGFLRLLTSGCFTGPFWLFSSSFICIMRWLLLKSLCFEYPSSFCFLVKY